MPQTFAQAYQRAYDKALQRARKIRKPRKERPGGRQSSRLLVALGALLVLAAVIAMGAAPLIYHQPLVHRVDPTMHPP